MYHNASTKYIKTKHLKNIWQLDKISLTHLTSFGWAGFESTMYKWNPVLPYPINSKITILLHENILQHFF